MYRLLFSIIAMGLLSACGREPEPAESPSDAAAGQVLADRECSGCHGLDGRGRTEEIPNLAGQPEGYLAEAMHAYADGRRHHAALQDLFSSLQPSEIRNIAAWYASLPPIKGETAAAPGPVPDSATYSEGREVASVCTRCHGERGFSTTPGVPSLAGQQPAYLIVSTQEYASGERGHVEKGAMLSGLADIDIEKMAMYFAAQVPPVRPAPPFGDPQAGEPLTADCGRCHGARGISNDPLVPSLAGQEPNYLVSAIKAYRDQERVHEDMVTDKSDEEIENIAAFYAVQSLDAAVEQGMDVAELAAKCDRCHGRAAGESSLEVPSLKGQKYEYLIHAMQEYRTADRGSSMMHKMSSGFDNETIEALAAYYADRR